jgi:drug/metabolite transporter (DMT)-like permease
MMTHEPSPTKTLPTGVGVAILAAALFGASTPFAKVLLGEIPPVLLAGLLYLGSGVGLTVVYLLRRSQVRSEAPLSRSDLPWLAGAVVFGGVLAPLLLMLGLRLTPASTASLLLNLEGVFTALLAWFVFRENFDRRIALGMACLVAGALVLSRSGQPTLSSLVGPAAIVGACVAWGLDNNLTRKVSLADPLQIVELKGLIAGPCNIVLGLWMGGALPDAGAIVLAGVVGMLGYGASLALFVVALRHLGTARTGAYFSTAPFFGAATAVLALGEPLTAQPLVAAGLMAIGVWLHITEHHEHFHVHDPIAHDHAHTHDEHHQHEHGLLDPLGEPHTHPHRHAPLAHAHHHMPDEHHRHRH